MKAEYRCLKCQHQWKADPGPTPCPWCGHDYVKWLNYEEMEKVWGPDLESKIAYLTEHPND
ncbi:hypothetical protein ES703_89889 [subsurface metagenome]